LLYGFDACSREPVPFDFRLYKGGYSLYFLFRKLVLLWLVQGSLFPLPGYVCLFVLLVSSLFRKLVLLFLIYTILTFDKKKKKRTLKLIKKELSVSQIEREFREMLSFP
jgi:hypothetical protein